MPAERGRSSQPETQATCTKEGKRRLGAKFPLQSCVLTLSCSHHPLLPSFSLFPQPFFLPGTGAGRTQGFLTPRTGFLGCLRSQPSIFPVCPLVPQDFHSSQILAIGPSERWGYLLSKEGTPADIRIGSRWPCLLQQHHNHPVCPLPVHQATPCSHRAYPLSYCRC